MRLLISFSERFRLGMTDPGLAAGGARNHVVRFLSLSSNVAPAKVSLLCRWVRLGPTTPADTPLIVWHPAHPLARNRSCPTAAAFGVAPAGAAAGVAGGACCSLTHRSKSVGVTDTTRRRM